MIRSVLVLGTVLLAMASLPDKAGAVACAAGVYRAGCVGPNGAAMVCRPPYYAAHPRFYGHPGYYGRPGVACASGPYRAGCAGPHGAVVRTPYY